ncbi:MAG: hypothetical protein PHQ84_06550 [Candidatus Omnitrophica bacterium]|jgi:hypothetical protein|nr:hypothetical protein [Candidatus Omnitrophota bacterium]MDD5078647.1 hypothetical protein [Candidatus Omnitrophota bacterium]
MRKHIFFLKCSSVVVKVAAWIILFLGIFGGSVMFFGQEQGSPRWPGAVVLVAYSFVSGVLFLIARMSDILVKIISQIKED